MGHTFDRCEEFPVDGTRTMRIRPMTVDDAERLQELYTSLAPADRRTRFFTAWKPSLDFCRTWASVGERGGFGVIAVVEDADGAETPAGEAGYAMLGDGDGDLAVTVAERWRGWLGAYLLDRIVEHAAATGVPNLQADVLLGNSPMQRMLRHRGAVVFEHADGSEHLSISTAGYVPSWPPGDERRRVLVEVAGGRWSGEKWATDEDVAVAMCTGPAHRTRHPCPVLSGDRCPLADGADAIVVVLDPDDESTASLLAAHGDQNPTTPVFVRSGGSAPPGCELLTGDRQADLGRISARLAERPNPPPD